MEFLEELQWRGLVKDMTDPEGIRERLKSPAVCYCGFDPTADSLHIGHLQQILLLRRYQLAGHTPIALCGGFTGMIGDPRPAEEGAERKLLSREQVEANAASIARQLGRFLSPEGENAAIVENNDHWLGKMSLLDFLREYGKLFNVAYMINKETIRNRLESGISYTEFSYTILQAVDWLHLYRQYHCELQIGGSDQWGNLTSGTELIRKVEGEKARVYGITSPLITRSDGVKFGKSQGRNVWLDPKKTSAYEFYQYWLNTPDSEVVNLLKRLSLRSVEEIQSLAQKVQQAPERREAQKALAREMTALAHGEEGLKEAEKITSVLFGGDIRQLNPQEIRTALSDAKKTEIPDHTELIDAMIRCGSVSSRREARDILRNGVLVNGERVFDEHYDLCRDMAFEKSFVTLRKGKKSYFILTFGE